MAYHIPSWEIMGNHGKSWEILAMAGSAASAASTASPHPSIKESTKGGGRRRRPPPFVEAAEGRLLYMMAWEVASTAKTYRRISKYVLNMYIDAYISVFLSKP